MSQHDVTKGNLTLETISNPIYNNIICRTRAGDLTVVRHNYNTF